MLVCTTLCLFVFQMMTISANVPTYRSFESFEMGEATVYLCNAVPGHKIAAPAKLTRRALDAGPQAPLSKANSNSTAPDPSEPIDLTPGKCSAPICYPGTFQPPSLEDCMKVIQAQLYHSTGSLSAAPGTWVFVSYGTCATVFQNPEESSYNIQYNWAELGAQAGIIAGNCSLPDDKAIGGVCMFKKYLKYTLNNVMISLQRFDDRDIEMPQ